MFEKKYVHLADIQVDLKAGNISCEALVQYYLNRIEEKKDLNAFVNVYATEALAQSKALDEKISQGIPTGRLTGMVIGVKDVICYKDHPVTAASAILENFTSLFSATAVERLLAEDAIIIGHLNCDEFAMGSSNENSSYGPVRNAYDENKVSGGSSGGSAVAVQADLCFAALGSDTGGSVRQPASFCNMIGFKPTYGRISRHGLIAYASSFDQIGTITSSVEDTALLLEIMSGEDHFDSTALREKETNFTQFLNPKKNTPKRIAYFTDVLEHEGLDPVIKATCHDFIQSLETQGHEVVGVSFPHVDYLVPTYYILTMAEASSNFARFDGIHYGYRTEAAKDMETTYRKSRTEGFGAEVKKRIMLGTFVLSAGYYDAYYAKAQKARRLISDTTKNILKDYDFILTPTTPTTAFDIGSKKHRNPISMYLEDIFTVQANLVGIPAVSLPIGWHNQLPFGMQFMADHFQEGALLAFAASLQNTFAAGHVK